ncbi:DUF4184 family protein [Leucothrix arctica]|nr:DUF4184 family protein [Leucothrix arctica]
MPFTLSHPVVSIPLRRYLGNFGILSALFIGAMCPDFVYMLPPEFVYYYRLESHSLMGLFTVCLPLGVGFFYLYHLLMAPVVTSIFPKPLKHRLPQHLLLGRCPPSNNAHAVIVSILIGAATHIIWDAFTHENALTDSLTWFSTPLLKLDGYQIMPFRVFQHVSTVGGLVLLGWWIYRWYKMTTPMQQLAWQPSLITQRCALLLILLIPGLAGLFYTYINMPSSNVLWGLHSLQHGIKFGIVGGGAVFIITSAIVGVFYQWLLYRENKFAS